MALPAASPPSPPRPLGPGEVELALAPVALLDDPVRSARYRGLLAPDEAGRYEAYRVEGARQQYLLTRALVRCTLSRHAPTPPEGWRFTAGANGRPEIAGAPGPCFNASNAAGLVACAVTGGLAVGVDVEPHGSRAEVAALGGRVLSPAELAAAAALPPEARADLALSLWTLKEAYAKALGLGLSLEPGAITFTVGPAGITLADAPGAAAAGRWHFLLLDHEGHRVALALAARPARLEVWRATPLVGFERIDPAGWAPPDAPRTAGR